MRQGYNWWEAFWKWLVKEADINGPEVIDSWMSREDLDYWLKRKKKEFEELWRTGGVRSSP